MTIKNVGKSFEPIRPAAQPAVAPTSGTGKGSTPAAGVGAIRPTSSRSDSVQISDAGRAMAGTEGGSSTSSLTPERVADLRRKVLEGAYNSVHVVDQVAKRILQSGDL